MMPNKTEFGYVFFGELEYNTIVYINPKAPDIVSLGMQFFGSENGIERIFFKKFCFFSRFLLNSGVEFFKQLIKCFGGYYSHYFLRSS